VIEKSVMAASFAVFEAIIPAACDRYGHTEKEFFVTWVLCITANRKGTHKSNGRIAILTWKLSEAPESAYLAGKPAFLEKRL
jgi:hypothetical protein